MASHPARRSVVSWLYNNNPFYVVSTLLMLFAIRKAYGELQVGEINCWLMMGVLAAYTVILAAIGVAVVRWGKVWEDARSILMIILLLFLAVSISADDLLVKVESKQVGQLLMLFGFLFSAAVAECVLAGTRIRLRLSYRLPLHMLVLLFFLAPWWCSPELHPRTVSELRWTIFTFPVAAGLVFLGLLPGVRGGPGAADPNGTPWRWPWFPWPAFVMIFVAVLFRTFALCLTFGPTGPIWVELSGNRQAIAFDTLWGPYFLIPPIFAVGVLLLEAAIVTKNSRLSRGVLVGAPSLLLLAIPYSHGAVFRGFLDELTTAIGTPLWVTVWMLLAFYLWAWLRGVQSAETGWLAMTALLAVIGPQTTDLSLLTSPQVWPLTLVATGLLAKGIVRHSSRFALAGCVVFTFVMALEIQHSDLSAYRMSLCAHLLWGAVIVLGLTFRDDFANRLARAGALAMPLASLMVFVSPVASSIPLAWKFLYIASLGLIALLIARFAHHRWYLYAFVGQLAAGGYALATFGFRSAIALLGQVAVTSFAWSAGTLLLAVLISAHKARWIPPRLFPRWEDNVTSGLETPAQQPATSPDIGKNNAGEISLEYGSP
jgi:hypothetical protein